MVESGLYNFSLSESEFRTGPVLLRTGYGLVTVTPRVYAMVKVFKRYLYTERLG